jgi:hypothetical protein
MDVPRLKIVQPLPDNGAPLNARLAASMLGTMLYPNEGQAQERLATSYALLLHWLSKYTGDPGADAQKWGSEKLATRLEVIQMLRFVELSSLDELRMRWRQGVVAGDLMRMLNWLYAHDPENASMKKARFMVADLYGSRVSGTKKPSGFSETAIKPFWKEFRIVSHWWAGIGEMLKNFQALQGVDGRPPASEFEATFLVVMNDPMALIAHGITHLKVADHLSMPTNKAPEGLLKWDQCWHVPFEYVPATIPAHMDPQQLYVGLSADAVERLKGYRNL